MAAAQVPDPRQPSPQPPGRARQGGWTAGRIIAVVAGAILVLCSVGLLGGSGVALWAQTNRHVGYADLATATYSIPGYAIASDTVSLHLGNSAASGLIGTVRIRVTQVERHHPGLHRHRPGQRGGPLPGRRGLRDGQRRDRSPWHLH